MKLRVAKKILKNQEALKYGKHQIKKADTTVNQAIKRATKVKA